MTSARRVLVLAGVALLLAVGLPALRTSAAHRQAAWEASCVASGGAIRTLPARTDNPLVVQLPRPRYECRSSTGALVSSRD